MQQLPTNNIVWCLLLRCIIKILDNSICIYLSLQNFDESSQQYQDVLVKIINTGSPITPSLKRVQENLNNPQQSNKQERELHPKSTDVLNVEPKQVPAGEVVEKPLSKTEASIVIKKDDHEKKKEKDTRKKSVKEAKTKKKKEREKKQKKNKKKKKKKLKNKLIWDLELK